MKHIARTNPTPAQQAKAVKNAAKKDRLTTRLKQMIEQKTQMDAAAQAAVEHQGVELTCDELCQKVLNFNGFNDAPAEDAQEAGLEYDPIDVRGVNPLIHSEDPSKGIFDTAVEMGHEDPAYRQSMRVLYFRLHDFEESDCRMSSKPG